MTDEDHPEGALHPAVVALFDALGDGDEPTVIIQRVPDDSTVEVAIPL